MAHPRPQAAVQAASRYGRLEVRISDARNEPRADVRVRVDCGGEVRKSDRTGPDGIAIFVLPAGRCRVVVSAPDRAPVVTSERFRIESAATTRAELVLSSAGTIAGRVRDLLGQPLADTLVYARLASPAPLGPEDELFQYDVSARDGSYRIEGLVEGSYWVGTVESEGYPRARRLVPTGVFDADLFVGTDSGLRVEGSIRDELGQPVHGATVLLAGRASDRSDALGHYAITLGAAVNRAPLAVDVEATGFVRTRTSVEVRSGGDPQTIRRDFVLERLTEASVLGGRAVDASGTPIQGRVELTSRTAGLRRVVTLVGGRFSIADLPSADDYWLLVRSDGPQFDESRGPLRVAPPGRELGDIRLSSIAVASLEGVLVDTRGDPVSGPPLAVRSDAALGHAFTLSTDDRGRFSIEAIPAGPLFFETMTLPSLTIEGLELAPGERRRQDLVVDWGEHEIEGLVDGGGACAAAGAQIVLRWEQSEGEGVISRSSRMTRADPDGRYRFGQLGPGPHIAHAVAPGCRSASLAQTPGRPAQPLRLERIEASDRIGP